MLHDLTANNIIIGKVEQFRVVVEERIILPELVALLLQ